MTQDIDNDLSLDELKAQFGRAAAEDDMAALDLRPKMSLEEEIIASASGSHEPLPMLEVIFSRLVTALSPMLKSQNGLLTETVNQRLIHRTWSEAIEDLDVNGIAGVAQSSWGGPIIVAIDGAFLHGAIVYLLGGTPTEADIPNRAPTAIEKGFAHRLISQALDEVSQHFSRITEVSFKLDGLEGAGQLSSLLAGNASTTLGEIEVTLGPLTGRFSLILPLNTLEPARAQLSKMFLGEKLGADSSWRDHFAGHISEAMMRVTVELHRLNLPLQEVLNWRPGSSFDLGVTLDQEATVICAGHRILHGATGRKRNGKLALRVTREAGEGRDGGGDDDLMAD